jgi:hypothetical protein
MPQEMPFCHYYSQRYAKGARKFHGQRRMPPQLPNPEPGLLTEQRRDMGMGIGWSAYLSANTSRDVQFRLGSWTWALPICAAITPLPRRLLPLPVRPDQRRHLKTE